MAMHRVALSQLKTQPRRYVSVVLAILIGTAFLAAAFLVGASGQATLRQSLGAAYAQSDLVVLPRADSGEVEGRTRDALPELAGTPAEPGPVRALDGVADAYAAAPLFAELAAGDAPSGPGEAGASGQVMAMPASAELTGVSLSSGEFPAWDAQGQVAVDTATAEQLGVGLGDTVTLVTMDGDRIPAEVVGLSNASQNPLMSSMPQVWAGADLARAVVPEGGVGGFSQELQLLLADGADADAVAAAVQDVLAERGLSAVVATPDDAVRTAAEDMAGADIFGWVLGGFAALSLLVTALVIANTFQVLVAQRTRELALLRTLGSTAGQVRASVLAEAALVGLIGSVLGAGLAVGLTAAVVAVVRTLPNMGFVAFGFSPSGVLIAIGVGVLITVLAALRPALAATRVSPLQAMQPRDELTVESPMGRVRLVLGLLMALGGGALMVYGATDAKPLPAIGGGMLSFLGVMMLAALFVPAAVKAASALARPAGVPGKLAGLNAVRQRSRTTATASALLIGTTLVTLFLVGGRTAQDQVDTLLNQEFPLDLAVQAQPEADASSVAARAAEVDGVEHAVVAEPVARTEHGSPVFAVPAQDLRAVFGGGAGLDGLGDPGTILVPGWVDAPVAVEIDGTSRTFEPVAAGSLDAGVFISVADAEAMGWSRGDPVPDSTAPMLLVDVDDAVRGGELRGTVDDLGQVGGVQPETFAGGAPMRGIYAATVDAVMWIVVALLAVSVLIALIGVANTLSLSTIERTRENSLLRALGLSRQGLRRMIGIEAVLIAAVAALLGVTLGAVYGWAGSQLVLGGLTTTLEGAGSLVPVSVPWLELGAVVLVAALAGLLASLLPARRATRLSPVEGLATV